MKSKNYKKLLPLVWNWHFYFIWIGIAGCNKLVSVPQPTSSVTMQQVFSNDVDANSAILGVYSFMAGSQGGSFSNLYTTVFPGKSADDLTDELPGNEAQDPYLCNTLTPILASGFGSSYFWQPAYYDIYCVNSILAGIQASHGMSTATKVQLMGEAKFIRALCYFYLVNIFGDVPLNLNIDFNQTSRLARASKLLIYQQVIADLVDAQASLPNDYSISGGNRTRVNRFAAAALLARVYLYNRKWDSAAIESSIVIGSGLYRLVGVDSVFNKNSQESILQFESSGDVYPFATLEGNYFIPFSTRFAPTCWLSSELMVAFEVGDSRRQFWVDSTKLSNGGVYYSPFKYTSSAGQQGSPAENYTVLRLAEQYLIRAEAEANLGQINSAIEDVNFIRARANLSALGDSLVQSQVIDTIEHENRIEFFAEWGHRWFDLKRWGIAVSILNEISYKSGNIDSTQLLYPIPLNEIELDPNLVQNPGYVN